MDIQEIDSHSASLSTVNASYKEGTVLGPEDGVKPKPPPNPVIPNCIRLE